MELLLHWIASHGFDLVGVFGVIASLGFTGLSFRREEKTRRIGNLLSLTDAHRDIWTNLYQRPDLVRILDPKVDLIRDPVTNEEILFVTLIILHLNATWQAMHEGVFSTQQAVEADIRWLFSLPIPKAVWEQKKTLQDARMVEFVENCRK